MMLLESLKDFSGLRGGFVLAENYLWQTFTQGAVGIQAGVAKVIVRKSTQTLDGLIDADVAILDCS
jgi:hypothetical protein